MVAGIWHEAIKKAHALPVWECVGLVCPITLPLFGRRYVLFNSHSNRSGRAICPINAEHQVTTGKRWIGQYRPLLLQLLDCSQPNLLVAVLSTTFAIIDLG